ncbi:MAG: LacI family DNA-binding transcriptional regulator [Verrucomicrobia bacterium]|nr:LacI family DNA-binding transcriptional regulator [Verrucomicrobiota bacterium]
MKKAVRRIPVTSQDVAKEAGVSQPTVSRALAGDQAISHETRRRVLAAAQRLNYVTNRLNHSRIARHQRTRVVGVVVAALTNAYYTLLLDRLHHELALAGYSMILMIDQYENSADLSKLQLLLDRTLDGVLFTTATVDSVAVRILHQQGIPLVLAVRSVPIPEIDIVENDNVMGGKEGVIHLLELGHRRIGFIFGPDNTSTSLQRFKGATAALAEYGLKPNSKLTIWGSYSHETGYSGLLRLWDSGERPTAVFCGNDVIALGVLDGARKHGIEVPNKLSVVGFDDIPMAGWSAIQLTTVRPGIGELAALAARRLLERIQSPTGLPGRRDLLPTSLIRRATTASPS